jgi:predicted dehydrogenase
MKQVIQDLSEGATTLIDAPAPQAGRGKVLIDTRVSLVSAGTERMLMQFGQASMLSKARQQPDKVKQVIDKARSDGVLTTISAVRSKLAQPIPLGYSNVGIVRAVGGGVDGLQPGDRVVSNGPHAEVVAVARNLVARIPDEVTDEAASFTVLASIGLQGIRLAAPTIGEVVAVIGTGLIGLLTVQMLRANGCRVLAVDTDPARLALAEAFGAVPCNPAAGGDPVQAGIALSAGQAGVDAVIITASTKSNDVIGQAARMSRKRGRIVLVGVVGLELNRAEFYEKELSFQVSCSYGPGRYDPAYEDGGQDYPIGFVRWTQGRNFDAVLDLMAAGGIVVDKLVSHRFPIEAVEDAYSALGSEAAALGILLEYASAPVARAATRIERRPARQGGPGRAVIGCIGAGNFASRVLIPALKEAGGTLDTIVSSGGLSGAIEANKSDFRVASSTVEDILGNDDIDTVFVLTRHSSHAGLAATSLARGKHVFVEKPLAVDTAGLDQVRAALAEQPDRLLMTGFNRRFAPLTVRMKNAMGKTSSPSALIITVNAGALPPSHWTLTPEEGGRIIGEACHFIDLARHLVGHPITGVTATGLPAAAGTHPSGDSATIVLTFADGSVATILYLANGAAEFPKERIELFNAGRILRIENFLKFEAIGWKGVKNEKAWRQDKGHAACAAAFLAAVRTGGPSPIAADELFEVHEATTEAARQLSAGAQNS